MTETLDQFLKDEELTQAEFASMIGVSQAAVSRYVTGESIPEPEIMSEIIKVSESRVMPNSFYPMPE